MFKKGTTGTPSYRDTLRAHRKPHHIFRNGVAFVALALFAGAAALAVVKPSEAPIVYQAQQRLALPDPFPQPLADSATPFISETQIRRGDTLAALLQRLRVQERGLQQFLVQDKDARSIYKLYPGRTIQAALDQDGSLVWLRYNHTPGASENGEFVSKWLEVSSDGKGGFAAAEHSQAADTQVRIAESEIKSSLFGATDAADIPEAITLQMTEILGSKIDFMQDLRQGDRFRIIYESYSHDGREIGVGKILALEFINKNKAYEAVWYAPDKSSGSYYDFDGRSLKGAFLRTALKFSRISSTFGMRKHPVHGGWRGHKGVDYAAPAGTPIHATADGVVEFVGQQNGYGNTIILKHHSNFSTLYAHQTRFAKGLKKGDSVSQGDLIGYVGSTGWATGPHLHYEFRVDSKPIDPLSVDLPVARTLDGRQRKEFERNVAQYREHIQLLATLQSGSDAQVASR
ncbi:M23 family metallopeptidase [Pollutimonas bauzanensis]|uniref:Murein DD-endopeptidase MepM and murein hydrolase activator NlpD, contain LysM domain n=1 Tax=Pollutimonas bauzanensis TaxID=658167 RepID=A0A1M5TWJ6_9BURK|nr:M23 family metallopeptidase [Pollutimonas bauzanensis]SHH55167.1 Murein DD-endopeptidase MepM and murein hydrolase activator NlpD, contain LysM domain [Pollutimonas bauzanensis]